MPAEPGRPAEIRAESSGPSAICACCPVMNEFFPLAREVNAACGHVGRRRGSSSTEQPRGPSSGAQEGRWCSTGSSAPGALGFSTSCPAQAKPGDSGDWHWSPGRAFSPQKHAAMQGFTAHISAQDRRRRLLLREEKGRRVCSLVMQLEGASVSSGAVSGCCHRTMNSCCQGGTPSPCLAYASYAICSRFCSVSRACTTRFPHHIPQFFPGSAHLPPP